MGVLYPKGTKRQVSDALARMDRADLFDIVAVFEIPTADRVEWEHDELRQRICDFIYGEVKPEWSDSAEAKEEERGILERRIEDAERAAEASRRALAALETSPDTP